MLLDTDVVSALRRPDRHPQVTRWLAVRQSADLFLSVVTIGEIGRGITQQERRDAPFARELAVRLARLATLFGDRVLAFDAPSAQRAPVSLPGTRQHWSDDCRHGALERGLTVVTRNVSHFDPTGVRVLNPSSHPGLRAVEPSPVPPRRLARW